MTEILPEAREAAWSIGISYESHYDAEKVAEIINRAILAERERCAKVAEDTQILLTIGATSKMHARECREAIAQAIRSADHASQEPQG